jgi:hypothetical protein
MMRVRQGNGHPDPMNFDLFTDSVTAATINQGMLLYYQAQSQNMLRLIQDINGTIPAKKANFGFSYRSYPLFWPQGMVINIITHNFFDDKITAAAASNITNTARLLWILDFTGIYPGVISSERKETMIGDRDKLAALNPDFACVLQVNTQRQTLFGMRYCVVVECPASNLILENFSSAVPEPSNVNPTAGYPTFGTVTSTTTPTIGTNAWQNTVQSYTASCPPGQYGNPVTISVPAGTITSYVSQTDANTRATNLATSQALEALRCTNAPPE